jgi:hypothetical protein
MLAVRDGTDTQATGSEMGMKPVWHLRMNWVTSVPKILTGSAVTATLIDKDGCSPKGNRERGAIRRRNGRNGPLDSGSLGPHSG